MKFIEIEAGLTINFDKITSIKKKEDRTEVVLDGDKFVTSIPYEVLKKLIGSGTNELEKYVKQLAINQRFTTP